MAAPSRNRLDGPVRGLERERTLILPALSVLELLEFAGQLEEVKPDVLILSLQ